MTGEILAGDLEGKTAIIVDDLISTGGTLLRAAKACRSAGARQVYAAACHGLFNAGATKVVADPAFDGIVIADTVPPFRLDPDLVTSRIAILDSTEPVASAIAEDHGAF